jgi:hypothetical protein
VAEKRSSILFPLLSLYELCLLNVLVRDNQNSIQVFRGFK